MAFAEYVQLYLESPHPGLRVIRVAGRLDPTGAARIVRLVDTQIRLGDAARLAAHEIVLDVAEVTDFAPGALDLLQHAHDSCRRARVGLHLTGCAGRLLLLPVRVRQALTGFPGFPTLDAALDALAPGAATGQHPHPAPT